MGYRALTATRKKRFLLLPLASHIAILFIMLCATRLPAADLKAEEDIFTLGILDLMNTKVTTVSRKPQQLANAAAAIHVITQEDIRRSGATSIPEVLRLAPGVQVARIDANKWAISIRGFNGRFATKLLVLMDGRSVYSPLFSGVFWDLQDTVLADIERIEVIRGPGAALWGANAVNGVINIITKSSAETIGGHVNFGGGTEERSFATARYGMSLSEATNLRVYGKYVDRDAQADAAGNRAHDNWHTTRGGFRLDSQDRDGDLLTFQGDYLDGKRGETAQISQLPTPLDPAVSHSVNLENPVSGGNLLARWQRNLSATSSFSGQLYYDHATLNAFNTRAKTDTFDLDFQHRFACGSKQDIVWGLGFRFGHDEIDNSFTINFLPAERDSQLYSAFVHDEIALVPEYLSLILGSRFEHNRYSGFEIQPNGRLLWTPDPHHTVWASVSRAVRTPSRGEQDILYRQSVIPPPLAFAPPRRTCFPRS